MNRYSKIIEQIFFKHYLPGAIELSFGRDEIEEQAALAGIALPKNIGDVVYSFRYRNALPSTILDTVEDEGKEWIILGEGKAKYVFKLIKKVTIIPQESLFPIKIPDATPEIIRKHALGDEQALLAIIRYNRLIDIFLGIASYSLQNHLRTTVKDVGQIEIDEIYVGIDREGKQFVVPVQAKGGKDKHGVPQTRQDILCCQEKFPHLKCRPVSAQFMERDKIALFELTMEGEKIMILTERHYLLVNADAITPEDLERYGLPK